MIKNFCFITVFLFYAQLLQAQQFAKWDSNTLILNNGLVNREIAVEGGAVFTRNLKLAKSDLSFDSKQSKEFSIEINNKQYDGTSGWELNGFVIASDNYQGKGATIKLNGTKDLAGVDLEITYLLYPNLPVIRKYITFLNNTGNEIKIESLDVEKLLLGFSFVGVVTYANYGRQKHLGTYIGDWDDPILAVHAYGIGGIILGNEAPGVLKRIAYNTENNDANIGLTHKGQPYPFRKYIRKGEKWSSPRVFVIPYVNTSDPWLIMNTSLSDFQRRHMGLRINEFKNRPTAIYNNYVPFYEGFNDVLMDSLSKVAAECGVSHFEIDCGWHTTYGNIGKNVGWMEETGDWIVNKNKFPAGLKPVFDKIKARGMVPGLWISVGSAARTSRVFKEHPEWTIKNKEGNTVNYHDLSGDKLDLNTMCFGTEWKDYIKTKILDLVREVGLGMVKLDLTVLTSAYVADTQKAGCSAKDHPYHKDREESLIVIYERLFELFDELHQEAPDLYIDCTFETAGKLQLIDYAFCQHAEGNWLTNYGDSFPIGAFRIRNLTWWKSPVIPASSFIIGNMQMDSPEFIQELKSLIGSFPIFLGDLRNLSKGKRIEIKQWMTWIALMQKKYNYDLYRQDLPSFGEPVEGGWDAWSRINTETKEGGIVGIFRQGSLDEERTVSIPGLDRNKSYQVKFAPSGEHIITATGAGLEEKGFKVKMEKKYDSKVYEIEMVK
jgi:alpha-galactosidase